MINNWSCYWFVESNHQLSPNSTKHWRDARKKNNTECSKCFAFGNGNSSKISLVSQIRTGKKPNQTKRNNRIDISDTRLNVENKIIHNHRERKTDTGSSAGTGTDTESIGRMNSLAKQVKWNMHRHRHRHTQAAKGDESGIISFFFLRSIWSKIARRFFSFWT